MPVRQPIVTVLGHVDHGKTTLLDYIRGTSVVSREAGLITQHIGATEVPLDTVGEICGEAFVTDNVVIPGLLFIDTPGHRAFSSLRVRGGTLADLAVLIVDIVEGLKPQTIESLEILKRKKTPFIIAANKVDRLPGWREMPGIPFLQALEEQPDFVRDKLDERLYDMIGQLFEHDVAGERFDRIADFRKTFAIIPMSAKHGTGISDILKLLIGLAQRFLSEQITIEDGSKGEGTVLEVKEEKGLGTTVDVILYNGVLKKGDRIAIGGMEQPIETRVKAILRPKPLDEIRDPRDKFTQVDEVSAAAGIKVLSPDLAGVVAGSPLEVLIEGEEPDMVCSGELEQDDNGITVKADTLGSLEAMVFECKDAEIPVKRACIGPVSRSDVMEIAAYADPHERVIMAFNVEATQDAELSADNNDVALITGNVIYKLLEDYSEWFENKTREMDDESRIQLAYPGAVKILPECIFRVSKPAIVGVRVLAGTIRPGMRMMKEDGKPGGTIKSIREGDKTLPKAIAGAEIALALEGVTCGRHIKVDDILYVDIPENHIKELRKVGLNYDETETMEKIIQIKRKESTFWGM